MEMIQCRLQDRLITKVRTIKMAKDGDASGFPRALDHLAFLLRRRAVLAGALWRLPTQTDGSFEEYNRRAEDPGLVDAQSVIVCGQSKRASIMCRAAAPQILAAHPIPPSSNRAPTSRHFIEPRAAHLPPTPTRQGNLLGFALPAGARSVSAPASRPGIFLPGTTAIHQCLTLDAHTLDPSLARSTLGIFFFHSNQTK
jgi:hypothetical protein